MSKSHFLRTAASVCAFALLVGHAGAVDPDKEAVKLSDDSFKCIRDLTPVRHFYVGNLLGHLQETVAVAERGKGDYPEGTIIQLVPTEAMVKQQHGYNPATRDWEFFALDIEKSGTKIFQRGYEDVNNRFGLNCFTCHKAAEADFDLVCEQDHGCAPIPITRAMFGALQRTDPRCANDPLTAEDKQALAELQEVVKTLVAPAEADDATKQKMITPVK